MSCFTQPVLACLHRRHNHRQYAYLEWVANETLQSHRLAQERANDTRWSHCTASVPTTDPGVLLSSLDISDLNHPRFPSKVQVEIPPSSDAIDGRASTSETLECGGSSPGPNCDSAKESQVINDVTNTAAEPPQVCVQDMATVALSPVQEQQDVLKRWRCRNARPLARVV
ncbi:hypothetical protein F5883DRAFT_142320 [Diaporthe sp. PMI_573]|nr:hypothetical protein F5883DRAFT_142320 [Diaporthaceae sp. PMI_573]